MILRCRHDWGMSKSQFAVQAFHKSVEASDVHYAKGYHRQRTLAYEGGSLVPTITHNIHAEIDALNDWHEPNERQERSFADAGDCLKALVCWIVQADSSRTRLLSSIARRAVCLSFVVAGDSIPWQSLQEAATEFKCTKPSLGKYSKEILQLANGNFQRSEMFRGLEARQKRAETTRRVWDRRGRKPRREAPPPRQPITAEEIAAKKERQRAYYKAYHHARKMRNLEQSLPLGSNHETPADHTSPAV